MQLPWLLFIFLFEVLLLLHPSCAEDLNPIVEFAQTAEELLAYLNGGVQHIVIQKHLDLRRLEPTQSSSGGDFVALLNGTKSIRVCSWKPLIVAVMMAHLSGS
jgi:hypothetical protein